MSMQVTYKSMINCFESFIMIQYFDAMNILLVWRILKLVLQFLSRKMHLKSGFDLLDLAKNVYKMWADHELSLVNFLCAEQT